VDDSPRGSAGTAYLIRPDGPEGPGTGSGPGVLVLSSWWGLTRGVKDLCERLADQGFVALAPDLVGSLPETAAEAELELERRDPNAVAALLISSVVALRSQTDEPAGPVAVVGFSMGASWALWLATRQPESVSKVVAYYGTQRTSFAELRARVQGHFAEHDELVGETELVELESALFEVGHEPEVWHYPGTRHWFAEPGVTDHHDVEAADLAWLRTLEFLRRP